MIVRAVSDPTYLVTLDIDWERKLYWLLAGKMIFNLKGFRNCKRGDITGTGEDSVMRSIMIRTAHCMLFGGSNEEMGRRAMWQVWVRGNIQIFGGATLR